MESLTAIEGLPVHIPVSNMQPEHFISWFLDNRNKIDHTLTVHGAVKFQGVSIESLEDFQNIVNGISTGFLNYVDGNSPRTKLTGNVYTSTEYDKNQKITMHNELSYSAAWPGKLYFSCLIPAATGGETLLADSRKILQVMNRSIVEEVQAKGVLYIRNLHAGAGMGPSWQKTFETTNKGELEAWCRSANIQFEWRDNDSIRLKQFSKGITRHRATGEWVWFNQIDQFHSSHLGEELLMVMQTLYGSPEELPLNVQFGDGTIISNDFVKEIIDTIDGVTIAPAWHKNEFLIIDNELVCHGRNPYTGSRSVLVSMSK
jgi:alpha-ketoglutarate-dependent taurine dioxygenase